VYQGIVSMIQFHRTPEVHPGELRGASCLSKDALVDQWKKGKWYQGYGW
jgi:hypothetical protein